jgi:Carboxypeptidase regulatory-like domain/TonB dependent receptor/TonB-dependent Receptor Plug Domain
MTHRPSFVRSIFFVVCVVLCAVPAAFAQSGSGSLSGHVTDATGATLPGVTLTATNDATGSNRSVVTEADGSYKFLSLPPGVYTVVTELSGFGTLTTKRVEIQVATERTMNVTLKPAAVSEQITVTAEAPLVATSPSVGTVVSQRELENLPLNGRQFANLGSLAPGTTLSVNSDPTKPGQLTIALNGGSGRNVNFLIDGGDNTDDTIGGALQNFNIEAVQEFKIQTMQYKAEYGRSSGGVLSVVTKTGTNDFMGSAYDFYRAKSLNSLSQSEIDNGNEKQPYRRDQYGFSLGGPIVKDKAHFFGTYEKTKRTTTYTVQTPLLPSFNGQSVTLPFQDELGTVKASVDATPKQYLQVRYGYQKNSDKYGAGPLTAPTALGTTTNKYWSALAGDTWQISNDKLNDFVFQRTDFKNLIAADSQDPYIYFPSGANSGQSPNTPQSTIQKKWQFKDDFSFSHDMMGMRNDFKVGANYINEPTLGGDFTVGTTGQYNLLQDRVGSPVESILINGGFSGDSTPIKQYNFYGQDDIGVNNRLTVNVGLRYDLWTGYDLNQSLNPNLKVLQAAADSGKYTESYIQDFKNGGGTKLKNDKNNWSPRLGFTYDMAGNGKSIVRGGLGRYYDFPYTNATILFPASAVQSLFGPVYNNEDPNGIKNADGSFFQPGQPLPPNQISGKLSDRTTRELASPSLATPYSDQISLGYSMEVSNALGLNFELVHANYKDIPFRFRANPIDPTTGARRFAPVAPSNFRLWVGTGHAKYEGANIGFHARLGTRFEAQGFYTLSKSTGNIMAGADEFRVVDAGYQPDVLRDTSVDPLNPNCSACNGPLDTDARHRVTLSGVYRAPFAINLSGILRYHSATPYTVFAGSDLNHDGYSEDLAPGHTHVNDARGASFSQVDMRLSKEFRVSGRGGIEAIAEVFNLFNSKNPAGFNSQGVATLHAGDPLQGDQRVIQLGARVHF